ncbi:MAG: carboxypeptidase regulatory-like domain-containing protein [Terracidiphilus sp.]|jgi:hypothetical protein
MKRCAAQTLLMMAALPTLFIANTAATAQVLYGSLTGSVTDKTGAVIPGVTVTITNQDTGAVRGTTSDESGNYLVLNLLPGTYSVSVLAKVNFGANTVKNIQVEVNRQVRVDITLQPSTVSTQVTVTDAPPELQTETGEVNSEISETQLTQLPITSSEGRNFQSLYSIVPGASYVQEKNSVGGNPARAMSVNVNGNSYNGNTTRLDGAINSYGWLPYLIAYVPPADSIENVSFTTNAFNAEQGLAGGASVKITTKNGTRDLHGGLWEYYQDAAMNARPYTTTTGVLPKNIYQEYGFNVGGPVYIPRMLTGRSKLFFFTNFDRITRRQAISGNVTVPDTNMIAGNFSEVASGLTKSNTVLYDPAPATPYSAASGWGATLDPVACPASSFTSIGGNPPPAYSSGYLIYSCRPSFTNEYGETGSNINTIPATRIAHAASVMMTNLQPIAAKVGTPSAASLANVLANDVFGSGIFGYNRNASDTKITYIPNESTQIFGKYGISPYTGTDPQQLGAAGGGTYDGGQPGAAAGRIQNVGLGVSHVFSPRLVIDADFGYTRQVTGAQSTLDLSLGDYGTNELGIPGTNGVGKDYVGQPGFVFSGFNSLGNPSGSNPFLFRDNQFTGDVNLSWVKGKHATKYGFTYFHFDLNHFQPTSGGGVSFPRGGFMFQGGMTCGPPSCAVTGYNTIADFLLGLPNNGSGSAVAKSQQTFDPNSLRWSTVAGYAQDQWSVTPKFTFNYGVRYEMYPPAYRDHTGVTVLIPGLPQSANVEVGGVNGNPKNSGINVGYGFFAPRIGLDYRLTEKTVIRTGFGLTADPDSMRYLRDEFPEDLTPSYSGAGTGTIATDPANNSAPMTLAYGIPIQTAPNYSSGFASLPVSGSTTTVAQNFRRGYIESWNLFIQRDLGHDWVANVGYVGTHFVRQQIGWQPYNAAPLPSTSTPCMPNGQFNTALTGQSGPCGNVGDGYKVNETINSTNCGAGWLATNKACYNTGGITYTQPLASSMYDALQSQLTHNAGKNVSLGVVYTYSHAIDFEDNGAGSGAEGLKWNYPSMFRLNRGTAGYDQKHNVQVWSVYHLPFGYGQKYANQGLVAQMIGGFQLNGQFSHYSGFPFAVSASSNIIGNMAPGAQTYAQLVAPYQQQSGHERNPGKTGVTGGKPWFNPASFANPTELPNTVAGNPNNVGPTLSNTGRNSCRGPGVSMFNASLFRSIHLYRESDFQIRFEAFNVFNHAWLNNPNATVAGGTFGYITSYGPPYSPTQGARSLQFSGRYSF